MSAYAALFSLKNTLHHILHSSRLSLVPPSPEIIHVAYKELQLWETILQRLDESSKSKSRKKVNALDGRIKDILRNFEDLLESLVSHQITLQSGEAEIEKDVLMLFSIDLQSLQDDVHSFIHTLKFMEKEYIYEVDNMPEDEDEDEPCIASRTVFGDMKSKMIGLSDQFALIKILLRKRATVVKICVHALVGMAGVGKTRLAREIYEDPEMMSYFDFRLWITLGRKSSPRLINQLEVSRTILAELKGDEKCLIVLDDVWEQTQELSSLLTSFLKMKNKFTRILLTARDQNAISYVEQTIACTYPKVVRFLNEEESKDLLCHKVFGEKINFPPQLDKAATKIAKKCEGLPLTIVTVADLLSKAHNRDPEYWEDVAEERNSVFTDAYNQISKVLFPSYDYLPQRLKMLFLYMAVFPRDYEIPQSKIINMLKAEGWFLDPHKQGHYASEESIRQCLQELCTSYTLVLFKPKSSWSFATSAYGNRIKTCRLHSAWRHLCRGEAQKNKFYHVLNRIGDASEQGIIQGQRCLCLENNILFGFKAFCNSVKCYCASSTRSLLFFGPYQQYPIPIGVDFKFLRELDALQLRFYTFPTQVLKLVQLKYLALTCNGQLPSTISKLFNLKFLIVHPHMSITKCRDIAPSSYIPIEIWDMKELEHIEILGKSFLAPPNDHDVKVPASLEKVSTLVGVNVASICTITKRIPNIRKLGVRMELTPYDDVDHSSNVILSCFHHMSTIARLKTLKCSVVNPVLLKYMNVASSCSLMFPRGLRKLHLSGMGLPWEYMDAIGSLPCLQVLKLRSYAFRGSKWEARGGSFLRLNYLLIEASDLVEWKPASGSFLWLNYLSLKHCYKLQELQLPSKYFYVHGKIELVNCNPLAVTCANQVYSNVTATDDFEA